MENNIKISIRKIFKISEKKYTLLKNDNTYNIIINDGKNNCVDMTIYIDTNDIHINHIDRCKLYRGKQSVENILEFAKDLGITKVTLLDKSTIVIDRCNFLLPYYYILLHGISWYNSFGFKSINHEEEQIINSDIPMMTLNEFQNILIENYNKKTRQIIVDDFDDFDKVINIICLNQKKDVSEKLKQLIDISLNIKDLIENLVKNIEDDEICLFLQCVIFVSKIYLIKYNPNLSYIVNNTTDISDIDDISGGKNVNKTKSKTKSKPKHKSKNKTKSKKFY